ncbi:MAG: hypothetical protein WD904_10045 [Dehalococcoidia bacterium]
MSLAPDVPSDAVNVPTGWRLAEEPSGNTLELSVAVGGSCESFHGINVIETAESVSIEALVRHEVGEGVCLTYLAVPRKTVELDAPLGDRELVGCARFPALAHVRGDDDPDKCREVFDP